MRVLCILSLCGALFCAGNVSAAQTGNAAVTQSSNENEAAIRGVVDGFAKNWNTPGMPGFADLFTEDADFMVISGRWFKGRDEIVNYHKALLSRFYKGSKLEPESVSVRFLSPNSAVAHVSWKSWYTEEDKQQEQTALMTMMLTKQADGWKIAAAHNNRWASVRVSYGSEDRGEPMRRRHTPGAEAPGSSLSSERPELKARAT